MIGIFDSGVGGLSVFREIRRLLPEERYIYYSDNAHCPYGEKTQEYIIGRATEVTSFLIDKGADIVVVACNTATAAAIKTLRESFPVRFIGMEPAIKPAAAMTETGVVGVLATAGTLSADKYQVTREKYSCGVRIVEHVGVGFVELVESGMTSGVKAENTVEFSLRPLLEAGADTVVLGCTHYPFLSDTIAKVASRIVPDRKINIIDPAPAVARHLYDIMKEVDLIRKDGFRIDLHSSGDIVSLRSLYDSLI